MLDRAAGLGGAQRQRNTGQRRRQVEHGRDHVGDLAAVAQENTSTRKVVWSPRVEPAHSQDVRIVLGAHHEHIGLISDPPAAVDQQRALGAAITSRDRCVSANALRNHGFAAVETPVRTALFGERNQFGQELDHLRTLALSPEEPTKLIMDEETEV